MVKVLGIDLFCANRIAFCTFGVFRFWCIFIERKYVVISTKWNILFGENIPGNFLACEEVIGVGSLPMLRLVQQKGYYSLGLPSSLTRSLCSLILYMYRLLL